MQVLCSSDSSRHTVLKRCIAGSSLHLLKGKLYPIEEGFVKRKWIHVPVMRETELNPKGCEVTFSLVICRVVLFLCLFEFNVWVWGAPELGVSRLLLCPGDFTAASPALGRVCDKCQHPSSPVLRNLLLLLSAQPGWV